MSEDEGLLGPGSAVREMYISLYGRESLFQALHQWKDTAKGAGINKAALAYWLVTYHSTSNKQSGEPVIVGASKVWQLKETLEAIEDGPLGDKAVEVV